MLRARKSALFRSALAAALAAITIPFIAHAAFGEETVLGTPTAQVFPTRTGIGVTWGTTDATAYRVERKQTTDWQDVSGPLAASTTTWVDETIAAGATADYRVVATTDTETTTSPELHTTRVEEPPAVGEIDVLALDANRSAGATWLHDETAGPVTASAPVDGSRTLTAGPLKVRIPAFFAGPGYYGLPSQSAVTVTQGTQSCDTSTTVHVQAVTYTADGQLETLAASLAVSTCPGAAPIGWFEIRYRSAVGYSLLAIAPDKLEFGRVQAGSPKSLPVTLTNTGTEPLGFGQIYLRQGNVSGWQLDRGDCWTLAAGASCTLNLTFDPGGTYGYGDFIDDVMITQSSSIQAHAIKLTGTSVSLPKAPDSLNVAPTYSGTVLSWLTWKVSGGTPVRAYVVHRYLDGVETTQQIPADPAAGAWTTLTEPNPKPGMQYALSVVNDVGEGPASTPKAAPRATDQVAVTIGQPDTELATSTLSGYVVPLPKDPDSVTPKEALAAAPGGRALAYVTTDTEQILWTRLVAPGELGVPAKLWTSTAPITHLSWSPDGSRIAFQSPENGTPCVYVVPAAGGAPVKITCDVTSPSWMPDAQTLVVSDRRFDADDRFAQIKAAPGGARIATLPAPTAAADGAAVRVSPDGRQVAFGSGSDVKLIDFSSDTITVTRTLDATVRSINWSPDGKSLLALSDGNNLTSIYPSTHGAVELDTNTSAPRRDIAWQQLGLVIAPTLQVVGTRASIVFDSSALPPGTTFTCSAGTSAPAPCTSPYQATGLRQIENTVVITAKEPDGRVTTARRTLTVDETAPVARVTAPNYQSSVAATANITVSATDASGVASYDVRYRRASFAAPYSAYIQPWTNTTATTMTLAVAAGYEYCVSVRAKDKLGNIGAWSAERCFSRPLDDRSMSMATTGWARGSSSKFYFGTDTQTTASGKALTRTVQGKRFFLVATRCPSCGAVAVYAGNRLLSTVNLAYPTTHYQVVLGLPVQSTLFSGTLTVRTVSTGKLVQIDGLAVGRT
jgi:dipeptidyl aminopeptidase/acylaminoacyl peptidase